MKYISRLILLIYIFFVSIIASFAFDTNSSISSNNSSKDTISAVQYYNQDIINSKDNELLEINISRNDNIFLNNRKTSNLYDGGINNSYIFTLNQFQNLLYYIYTNTFLDNKTSAVISFLVFEIQPNAP